MNATIFDWSIAGVNPPTIVDTGEDTRFRYEIDVEGSFDDEGFPLVSSHSSREAAEIAAWTNHFESRGMLVPSVTGLVLDACPSCGGRHFTVGGEIRGHLMCRVPGCRWTEVGLWIKDTDAASALPWPDGVALRGSMHGPIHHVMAWSGRDWCVSGDADSFEEAAAVAFDRYLAEVADVE